MRRGLGATVVLGVIALGAVTGCGASAVSLGSRLTLPETSAVPAAVRVAVPPIDVVPAPAPPSAAASGDATSVPSPVGVVPGVAPVPPRAPGSSPSPAGGSGATGSATSPIVFAFTGSANPQATVRALPPEVRGVSWILAWRDIEPKAPVNGVHHYDWQMVDADLQAAAASGRVSMLRVQAGASSPDWLPRRVTITFKPGGPQPEKTITMPIPWDPDFEANWTAFIRAYGARYDGDHRIFAIEMPGGGWQGEMTLPEPWAGWTNGAAPPNGTGAEPFTPARLTQAWDLYIDTYRAAFPHTPSALDIGEPLNKMFPNNPVMNDVIAHAARYRPMLYFQQNGLRSTTSLNSTIATILRSQSAATTVGWQEWGPVPSATELQQSLAVARNTHASYVEVYVHDCENPAYRAALDWFIDG